MYVSEGGGLTLNLRDATKLDELAADGLIEHWADEAEFLLSGPDFYDEAQLLPIDEREALQHIWTHLVLPACLALLDDYVDKKHATSLSQGVIPEHGIADVYVGLDANGVCASLLHRYDGPFASPEEFDKAAARRMGAWRTPDLRNWDRP